MPMLKNDCYNYTFIKEMKKWKVNSYYKVERIQFEKVDEQGNRMYLVKWKGWKPEFNTWEPYKNISHLKDLIQEFEKNHPKTIPPNRKKKKTNSKQTSLRNSVRRQIDIESKDQVKISSQAQDEIVATQSVGELNNLDIQIEREDLPASPAMFQPIKRKRGRPRLIRPEIIKQKIHRLIHRKQKEKKVKQARLKQRKPPSAINKLVQIISPLAISQPVQAIKSSLINQRILSINYPVIDQPCANSQPIVKLEYIEKAKAIRKRRKEDWQVGERKSIRSIEKKERKEYTVAHLQYEDRLEYLRLMGNIIQQQQREQLGLEQILFGCKGYSKVRVAFENKTFYYQIPYLVNKEQRYLITTAQEIIKVNPKWLEDFFQGFYV